MPVAGLLSSSSSRHGAATVAGVGNKYMKVLERDSKASGVAMPRPSAATSAASACVPLRPECVAHISVLLRDALRKTMGGLAIGIPRLSKNVLRDLRMKGVVRLVISILLLFVSALLSRLLATAS